MRFDFDPEKKPDVKRKHGVSLKEAREIFDQVYLVDQKNDDSGTVPRNRMESRSPVLCDFRNQA